jgi:hypothetical protein
VTDVRARWLGHRLHAEVNIAVPSDSTVREANEIAAEVRHQLLHQLKLLSTRRSGGAIGRAVPRDRAAMTICRSTPTRRELKPAMVQGDEAPNSGTKSRARSFKVYRRASSPAIAEEEAVIRFLIGAGALALLAANPAFAVGPNCGDQLAQIKAQLSSEQLAQSNEAKQFEEAERLCKSGKDMEAQGLARQIREEMAQKGTAGASDAPKSAGGPAGQSK